MLRYCTILCLLCTVFHVCHGQYALKVGDTCPNFRYAYYTQGRVEWKDSGDLQGRWKLLDFWATYCGGCIKGLSKLERLGEEVGSRLAVLAVATQDEDKVRAFWDTNYITQNLQIGTALKSGLIDSLFPRKSVPHYVLLDPYSRIVAITYQEFITLDNLLRLINGEKVYFADKWLHEHVVEEDARTIFVDKSTFGSSSISRYDPRKTPSTGRLKLDTLSGEVTLAVHNNSIYDLYLRTVDVRFSRFSKLRRLVNIDSSELYYKKMSGVYQIDWTVAHTYNYALKYPGGLSFNRVLDKMRGDLDFYFKLRGEVRSEKMKVWVLQRVTETQNICVDPKHGITWGSLINMFNKREDLPYIIDESEVHIEHIICRLDEVPIGASEQKVLDWLNQIGVRFIEEERAVECFVLVKD